MTFRKVIILIKLVVNKNKHNYYYDMFLEKGLYKDKSNTFLNECLCITNDMFYRIDTSEGIDVNKTVASKEYDICHYLYFLSYSFKFQSNVCNRCHALLMMSMNISDIAILNITSSDYWFIVTLISKNEVINLMQNVDLTKNSKIL